ncbi:hypothetical protein [Anaerosporobacter sp.]|uniref:hypothetical protein n=1 Tax=Anaerosporobacter sp. TaxID=1872529 RepID=UPI00286F5522|nr:hypothetical protein [Anaerosporobacter sp.]
MNLLQTPLTLLEIEQLLEKELRDETKGYRIIGDLELTYEEYCFLELKAKGLKRYGNDLTIMEKYRFVVLVSWVFSMRYGNLDKVNCGMINDKINKLPQHIMRKTIHVVAQTFEDYGINTYGLDIYSTEGLFALIGIHAGIPHKAYDRLFGILDDSLNYKDMNRFEGQLMTKLEPRMTVIYEYMDEDTKRKLFHETRDIFIDCRVNNLSIEELKEKYIYAANSILEACARWCEEMEYYQDQNEMQLLYK